MLGLCQWSSHHRNTDNVPHLYRLHSLHHRGFLNSWLCCVVDFLSHHGKYLVRWADSLLSSSSVGIHSKTAGQFPSESCPGDGPEGGEDV